MSLSALPIALCLFSAVTVAAANFAVKRGGDVLTARMVLSISMGLTVVPFIPFVPMPPANMWGPLITAVVVHWFYQFALIRSLHRGDLSLVFPVMRGLAPLLTAALAFVYLQESLSLLAMFGLVLASVALIVFAMPQQADDAARDLNNTALVWAVITAVGIGMYSVVDAKVIRAMPSPYTFIVWLFLLDWIGITAVTLWTRRGQIVERVKPQLKAGMLGGVAGTLSYGAALLAFTMMDAALVTALRETSVFWAALLGAVFLKEGLGPRRVVSAAVLAIGLVLMQIGGAA